MEKSKKHIKVLSSFHKELKRRAVEKDSTIEEEINEIYKKELGDESEQI